MPKYRAKPVVCEAVHWDGGNFEQVYAFAGDDVQLDYQGSDTLTVLTAKGETKAPSGFYIVRDDRGNHYPCDPGMFERKYERVD